MIRFSLNVGFLLFFFGIPQAVAQEFGKPIQGKVIIHEFSLTPDSVYVATLRAKKDNLSLRMGGQLWNLDSTDDDSKEMIRAREMFSPIQACKVTARIEGFFNIEPGTHEYTLVVDRFKLDPKPLLQKEGKLTAKDLKKEGFIPYQGFKVTLTKGRRYVSELIVDKEFLACPGFEYTEGGDSTGAVAQGDKVRQVFRPRHTGTYEVQAGIFNGEVLKKESCSYKLTVYQLEK
jgi:hypothetical protein